MAGAAGPDFWLDWTLGDQMRVYEGLAPRPDMVQQARTFALVCEMCEAGAVEAGEHDQYMPAQQATSCSGLSCSKDSKDMPAQTAASCGPSCSSAGDRGDTNKQAAQRPVGGRFRSTNKKEKEARTKNKKK